MRKKPKVIYDSEITKALKFYKNGEFDSSFHHLERAHIIGQSYVIPHTKSHWWMLKVGLKKQNYKEVFGQITRIIASVLFSRIWVPIGNTGGTNANPLKPMPVPDDLQKILNEERT